MSEQEQGTQADDIIDAIFAQSDDQAIEAEPTEEVIEDTPIEDTAEADDKVMQDEEKWPKKAEKAFNREKARNRKLMGELAQYRERLAALEQTSRASTSPVKDETPNPDNFDTYDEYMSAMIDFRVKKEVGQLTEKQREAYEKQQESMRQYNSHVQQMDSIAKKALEFKKTAPDLDQVISSVDVDGLPPIIQQMIASTPNPSQTAYNLIKGGEFDNLFNDHPQMAAVRIFNAQKQAPKTFRPNVATKPIAGVKGTSGAASGISSESSAKEILAWLED